jgi:hypothetical protein
MLTGLPPLMPPSSFVPERSAWTRWSGRFWTQELVIVATGETPARTTKVV